MVYELGRVGMVCGFCLIEGQKKMNELNEGDELKMDLDWREGSEGLGNWGGENGYGVRKYEEVDDG
ncbi:oxidoreductase [Staphylococcus epidermidis]|uniref:oxidoreductase n=1 Tax=Staphylococcus epidermidis TaxID=1282 RepID=UPI00119F7BDD|nr:oxidoreductase [Staphylococcus epidermidis]